MIREEDVPICPQCKSNDRVVRIRGVAADDLAGWFCDTCKARLSALPALPATGRAAAAPGGTTPVKIGERTFDTIEPQPTGQKPKRGKPKEGGGDGQ